MIRKTISVLAIMFLIAGISVIAGVDKADHSKHANFEGTLVCMGCDLSKTEGARSECKVYGHDHALKTADGKYVIFLENKYSADLISGEKYHNKKVKVHGIYFANANQLDIETFEVEGKKKSWCGGCSSMDGCSAK